MRDPVRTPRTSRARGVAIVAVSLTAAGVLVGTLWSWLAPPAHGVIALTKAGDRVQAYLGAEADHFFTAAAMLLGMLCVVAVTGAVAAWQWRTHRGPLMVVALCAGSAAGAALAAATGALIVGLRYDAIDIDAAPVSPEHRVHYVVEAPPVFFGHTPLQIAATLLIPAGTAALVYALMAMATARDDLGGYPPVPAALPAVTADGGAAPSR